MPEPLTPIEPRALENRPGLIFDALRLSNLYAEDVNAITAHLLAIETYINEGTTNLFYRQFMFA